MKEKLIATWQWIRDEKRIVWFEYSALTLAILLPLLLPGFILTLDMVFTPTITFPPEVTNTYPLQVVLWLFHFVLPVDVIQKILLFIILLFSGVGMHLLLRSFNMKGRVRPDLWRLAPYFGGIFYMINPFTYSRFMAGQWLFLLGYAMMPFFAHALLKFYAAPSLKTTLYLTGWALAIISVSIHHLAILAFFALLVPLFATIFKTWRKGQAKSYFKWSATSVGLLAALCSYWLIPAALGQGSIGSVVTSRSESDFNAFATHGNSALGAVGEVIRLQGFWAEARQLFTLPQAVTPAWGLLFLLVWVLVAVGAAKAWKASRLLVAVAVTCIIFGVILAATPLIANLSNSMPFLSGYREPHKFASLIVFGYALLGTLGVAFTSQWATHRFKETGGQVVIIACLLLPLVITPTMLWGFGGQLSPRDYPAGWYEMSKQLSEESGQTRVLFLPWHQYMAFRFSERIIANPAEKFFGVPTIASDDPEFGDITPTVPNQEKVAIKAALDAPKTLTDTLGQYRITHILLAKDDDFETYNFLNQQTGVKKVAENDSLRLYEVTQ